MSLIQLIYASAATKPFNQDDLRELLLKARTTNSGLDISGLLLYHRLSFFQILEGEEQVVDELYGRICHDPRHSRLVLLSKATVKKRTFGAWSMGFVDVDRATTTLIGFVNFFNAKSSFLDLQGDSNLVSRLIEGFQDGQWRQHVEK